MKRRKKGHAPIEQMPAPMLDKMQKGMDSSVLGGPGLRMMKLMGYEKGQALGKTGGIVDPIALDLGQGSEGLGRRKHEEEEKQIKFEQVQRWTEQLENEFVERKRVEYQATKRFWDDDDDDFDSGDRVDSEKE